MTAIFDANISWRLKELLKDHFAKCIHVDYCELNKPASDLEIWEYASLNNCIIFTNDLDFIRLSNIYGFPPKCIIIRTGNQSTEYISELIKLRMEDITEFVNNTQLGVLEIY